MVLLQRHFPRGLLEKSRDVFGHHSGGAGGVLLVSSGWRPEILLMHRAVLPTQRIIQAKTSIVLRLRNPGRGGDSLTEMALRAHFF